MPWRYNDRLTNRWFSFSSAHRDCVAKLTSPQTGVYTYSVCSGVYRDERGSGHPALAGLARIQFLCYGQDTPAPALILL